MRWIGVGRVVKSGLPLRRLEKSWDLTPLRDYHRPDMGLSSSKSDRTFKAAKAKGGCELDTSKTALVLIEYQF